VFHQNTRQTAITYTDQGGMKGREEGKVYLPEGLGGVTAQKLGRCCHLLLAY
jgi:hypothetical protein